ncbi:hypothetical protein [Rhizobium leguminosarum]|uniref:hypothetical protein n=1 Tax=Rhizobium leguminosarum TaxID=384 RepID=UPI00143F3AB0|nr:hypothetical protein [Rhizobium leguminosarum]NKL21802.1 hypothetical protein [Rhizobium leguminosarum bv. viciae]
MYWWWGGDNLSPAAPVETAAAAIPTAHSKFAIHTLVLLTGDASYQTGRVADRLLHFAEQPSEFSEIMQIAEKSLFGILDKIPVTREWPSLPE